MIAANNPGQEKSRRSFGQDITSQVNKTDNNYRNMNYKPKQPQQSKQSNDNSNNNNRNSNNHNSGEKGEVNETSATKDTKMSEDCCKSQEEQQSPPKNVSASVVVVAVKKALATGVDDDRSEQEAKLAAIQIKSKIPLQKWDLLIDESQDDFVTDYIYDVMNNLRNDEDIYCKEYNFDYMPMQADISNGMRSTLLNWLTDVHRKFHLMPSSLFTTIDLLDRYLSKAQVERSKLQMTGCACLWIASKYHEMYCPAIDDFTYISDNAFKPEDLVAMESDILKWVEFKITIPTVLSFAERSIMFLRMYLESREERKIIADLIMYCVEHLMLNYITSRSRPSLIVSVAFVYCCIGAKVFTLETYYKDHIDKELGYHLKDLLPYIGKLRSFVTGECEEQKKFKSLIRKYCSTSLSRVAKLDFQKFDISSIFEYANANAKEASK